MATTAETRPASDKAAFDASRPKAYKPAELLPDPPTFPDLTKEDNFFLAHAASQIVQALVIATEAGWIDDNTARAWLMKFAGEQNHGILTE